jgi:hypothetical protein
MQSMWACNKLRLKDALAYDREVLVYDAMCVPNNQEVYEDFVEPETWAIVSTKMMFNVKGTVSWYDDFKHSLHERDQLVLHRLYLLDSTNMLQKAIMYLFLFSPQLSN